MVHPVFSTLSSLRHMYIVPDGVVDVKCALEDDWEAGSADVSLAPVT